MSSTPNPLATAQRDVEEEDAAAYLAAMQLSAAASIPMVLKAAIELDVLEIIARAGPGAHLSPSEILAQLPAASPDAPAVLDRMMRFLAAHSVLTCTGGERRYGLAPVCRFLTKNRDGASLAALVRMNQDPVLLDSWQQLKYAVLEGVIPFTKAHGMTAFEYHGTDPSFNNVFNECMANSSTLIVGKILDSYRGFDSITQLVDVGGGTGSALGMIVAKHPHIKGINFDLPHVISDAPPLSGVEHVGGDMFVDIPRGENIFMKFIIHDWSDEHCLKILKNCWKALPEGGKVIVADAILPETPETNPAAQTVFYADLCMLTYNCGGKERTEEEFRSLAKLAGFTRFEVVCCAYNIWVMEFYK